MASKLQLKQLGLFDAKVPRYTSYPTAPHFKNDVTNTQFAEWIRAIPKRAEISLYVHVPFCRHLCWFCACRTQGTQSARPVDAYVETLQAELTLLKADLPAGVTLSRLHWGGGTPTLLSADRIDQLCRAIFDVAPLSGGGEFSVEIDPNEIDEKRLEILKKHGMNRASIGVQDFDPDIQKAIGRLQSYDTTKRAVDMLRDAEVDSLNADILYGLPHQTTERIADSVQKLLSLSPDRVALYGYAHVPWMAKRQQLLPTDALPTPQERLALFETAQDLFAWDGYDSIGIDHFARPEDGLAKALQQGKLRRNFQGYTDDPAEVLIGIGASSISRFPQGYAQNAASTSAHISAIRQNQFSTARGHRFTFEDKWRARMIEALMCDFEIRVADIRDRFDVDETLVVGELKKVAERFDTLPTLTGDGLYLPKEIRPLTRIIARAFDAYEMTSAQHSSAI